MGTKALLSGLALGAALGFVFQRGRFCLNTAIRDMFYIRNFTLVRSYLLALVVATVCSNLLESFGILSLDQGRQNFNWISNAAGGYLFGVGMVLAGGCAAGTWYRVGEGLVGSWMAAFGFMAGVAAAGSGALHGIPALLTGGEAISAGAPAIDGLLGVNRWVVIAIISVPAIIFVFIGRSQYSPGRLEYHWRTAGIIVGLVIALSWLISERFTGTAKGISLAAPSANVLLWAVSGEGFGWDAALLIGIPLGSFVSSFSAHEFSWRAPRAGTMVQQFVGGLVMGIGGALAGGCLIGHGLTGLAALSLASLVSTIFIVLGAWTMVYFLFMRSPASSY